MSNHSTSHSQHVAYIWTSFDSRGFRALRAALRSAPPLPGLQVASFSDGVTALFRLSYLSDEAGARALGTWAAYEGVELVDASSWSSVQRQKVATAVLRFRCRAQRRLLDGAILDLADYLEQSSALGGELCPNRQTLLGIPASSSGSCCTTLRTVISRHVEVSDGVPAVVDVRKTRSWWGQRSVDKSVKIQIAR